MMKRVLSLLMAVLMTLSLVGVTAFATDDGEYEPIDLGNAAESGRTISSSVLDGHRIDPNAKVNQVTESAARSNAPAMRSGALRVDALRSGENTPPVAELYAVILNPESVVNGNLTTATQIAWLWEYGDQHFTYDPDGDEIVSRSLNGVSSSDILGYLSGDIGFVTQFQTPAQYIMTFQVQDENGAWSNVAQYTFAIEPTDGNTRPICSIGISSSNIAVNQYMMISWANSSDPDTGDSVDGLAGVAILNGVSSGLSNYLVQLADDYCVLAFPTHGTYEIRVRVCDTHGAWSNWVTFYVNVESVEFVNLLVDGLTSLNANYWVNEDLARDCEVEVSSAGAQYLFDHFGSHTLPSVLPAKLVMDTHFSVSGRAVKESGSPLANASVRITMQTYFGLLDQTVTTDSNGYFTYNPSTQQYWVDIKHLQNTNNIDLMHIGTIWTEYAYVSQPANASSTGTSFVYPTSITVQTYGASYSENVMCEVGYAQEPIVGNLYYYQGNWCHL